MTKVITTAFALMLSLGITAQEKSAVKMDSATEQVKESPNSSHWLGLNAGGSTGYGFSYRYNYKKAGIQLTGIPILGEDRFWSSIGLQLSRRITSTTYNNDPVNFNFYAGTQYLYEAREYDNWLDGNFIGRTTSVTSEAKAAIGFGLEYITIKRLSLSLYTGYGLNLEKKPTTFFSAEVGILYRIN